MTYDPSKEQQSEPVAAPTAGQGKLQRHRNKKKNEISDIFGDFFGFGPNPPGCMAKGAPPVNYKQEKDKFLQLITLESKRYDILSIQTDLNGKIEQIVKGIKKEEKNIMTDEER